MIYIPHPVLIAIFMVAAIWKNRQYRNNSDPALLAVIGAFLCDAIGLAFGDYAKGSAAPWLLHRMDYEFIGVVVLLFYKYFTAAFFLIASQRREVVKRVLAISLIPMAVSVVLLLAADLKTHPTSRPYGFADPAVVDFNFAEKIFLLPIDLVTIWYAVAYLRLLSGTAARGIVIAAIGLALSFVAETTFTVELFYYAQSNRPPHGLIAAGRWEVYIGQLMFIVGISWYGIVMRIRDLLTGLAAVRDIVRLHWLWKIASATLVQFLPPRISPRFDALRPLTSVLERRQAMMVDIRDALMLLSPQIDPNRATTVADYTSEILRVAVANQKRPVLYGTAVRAAADSANSFDGDRRLLSAVGRYLNQRALRVPNSASGTS
ncbi:hypothetical protein [Nocardia terpenica]|uniref:hypothetical protein n=1 Tax=Nocardia terpenica TaxID=455432 RepID=UPI000AD01A50|nr:hypothetical protein [Nocardia terpenica]NQE93828.1 hypothetical protein [Nocardia terpenica]